MVKGFSLAAVEAAVKAPGRLDLGLIYSETPAQAVGLFTTNSVQAAPVLLTRPKLENGLLQAVVVNSGNANACTGQPGLADAKRMADLAAASLDLDPDLVGVCSTGVIGRPLPMDRLEAATPRLKEALGPDRLEDFARAIMTTDTVPKMSSLTLDLEGTEAHLAGVAKGSGMIHPNLATMLVFLMTDADVKSHALKTALEEALPGSFHGMTIDGETSTNDSLIFMANGAAGGPEIHGLFTAAGRTFFEGVGRVCRDLARQMVADAEGGTKVVTILAKGAGSDLEADMVAVAIALSPLCKTAFFGADPNWGRIICAAGASGARLETDQVDILFDDVLVFSGGRPAGSETLAKAEEVLKKPAFKVTIDLHQGEFEREFMTSDLSLDYVRINSEYTT